MAGRPLAVGTMTDEAIRTLRYWLDVEALTPPGAEEHDDEGEDHYVRYVYGGDPFPWQEPRRQLDGRPRRHLVRFGIIPTAAFDAELLAFLRTRKADDHDAGRRREPNSFTFLGHFQADEPGRPLPGTLELAVFAHSFAALRNDRLPSFGDYSGRMTARFDAMLSDAQAGAQAGIAAGADGAVAGSGLVAALVAEAQAVLGWAPQGLAGAPVAIVRCEAAVTAKGRPRIVPPAPINSFQYDAIAAVLEAVSAGKPPGLVLPYLAEAAEAERIDCQAPEVIARTLSPDAFPDGRWPSAHDLTLMQQVAVNEAMRACRDGGIFSVNGPPGTGKTTLLMDVVAAVVVERAQQLARFAHPRDAFSKLCTLQFPGMANPANIHALDPALHGFGIVVASSNNGAVENVTREFPNAAKLDPAFREAAAHFRPTAQALLDSKPQDPDDDEDEEEDGAATAGPTPPARRPAAPRQAAWGLISVALGRKRNRTAVIRALKAKAGDLPEPSNIFRQVKEIARTADWQRSKAAFDAALTRVREQKRQIAEIEALESALAAAQAGAAAARSRSQEAERAIAEAEARGTALLAAVEERRREFQRADDGAKLLAASRPSGLLLWLAGLLPERRAAMPRTRDWSRRFDAAVAERMARESRLAKAETAADAFSTALAVMAGTLRQAGEAALRLDAEERELAGRLEQARARHPGLITIRGLAALEPQVRQQLLPGSSAALARARAELFVEALALHRAFIATAGAPFEQNLKRALDMLSGDPIMASVLPKAAGDLWATLFLLVPVMSSTFASFGRSFGSMPPGSIGWLVVDEAGQAVPQHAVGALAKAKRAIVVGDPYQVEPVITLDPNVDAELLDRHGAPQRLRSTTVSMQVVADRLNRFGSSLTNHQGERDWVGSPLKVHRRCAEPMFSIANRIAYNGTMVLGRGREEAEAAATVRRPLFGTSRWIDVPGIDGNRKHFIPAQADLAFAVLRSFVAQGWLPEGDAEGDAESATGGLPDLYVISPFKSAADGMRDRLRRRREEWAPGVKAKAVRAWLKRSVGTVHTFQGKEAETVLVLLGGATDGAIEWAAKTPNILNVAATRAQRRLYVIGDWARWMQWPLAQAMGPQPDGGRHLDRVSAEQTWELIDRLDPQGMATPDRFARR